MAVLLCVYTNQLKLHLVIREGWNPTQEGHESAASSKRQMASFITKVARKHALGLDPGFNHLSLFQREWVQSLLTWDQECPQHKFKRPQ